MHSYLGLGRRTALLITGLLLVAGTTIGLQPADAASAPPVIHFKTGKTHTVYSRATAKKFLKGTPKAFEYYAAKLGGAARSYTVKQAKTDPSFKDCIPSSGAQVKIYQGGYAIANVGDCAGVLEYWTNRRKGGTKSGPWHTIFKTQDMPQCAALKTYKFPSAVAGTQCITKTEKVIGYHQAWQRIG